MPTPWSDITSRLAVMPSYRIPIIDLKDNDNYEQINNGSSWSDNLPFFSHKYHGNERHLTGTNSMTTGELGGDNTEVSDTYKEIKNLTCRRRVKICRKLSTFVTKTNRTRRVQHQGTVRNMDKQHKTEVLHKA